MKSNPLRRAGQSETVAWGHANKIEGWWFQGES